jgi:WD40 repeat protein
MESTRACLGGLALVLCLSGSVLSQEAPGRDGKALPPSVLRQLGSNHLRHPSAQSVAYSPDGTLLATGGFDIRFWDAATRRLLRTIPIPDRQADGDVHQLRFSTDGKTLYALVSGQAVLVHDVATGQRKFRLKPDRLDISALDLSRDGRILALGTQQGEVSLWRTDPLEKLRTLTGHELAERFRNTVRDGMLFIQSVALSADSKWLASSSLYDDAVRVWEADTGRLKYSLRRAVGGAGQVAFSPDGTVLALNGFDPMLPGAEPWEKAALTLWDLGAGKARQQFQHPVSMQSIAFSPDGKWLAAGASDYRLRVWDRASGELRFTSPRRQSCYAGSLAFSRDGSQVASCTSAALDLWDWKRSRNLLEAEGHTGMIRTAALSADGSRAASAGTDGILRLWDTKTGTVLYQIETEGHGVTSIAFSPDGRTLASGAYLSNFLSVWEEATGRQLRRIPLINEYDYVTHVAFAPDGKTIAVASNLNLTVQFFDTATYQELRRHSWYHGTGLSFGHRFRFSPDGEYLAGFYAAQGTDFQIALQKRNQKDPVLISGVTNHFVDLAFSPDGEYLAWSDPKDVHLWDVQKQRKLPALENQGRCYLAFTPDGRHLVAGRKIHPLHPNAKPLTLPVEPGCLTFSRDGSLLLVAPVDGCSLLLLDPKKLAP